MNNQYSCTALTGGGSGSLDAIDITGAGTPNVDSLTNGDVANVWVISGSTVKKYSYIFYAAGTDAESSPNVIRPDDYVTSGVWLLVEIDGSMISYGNTKTVAKSGGQYTTIQAAINASTSGDTILIYDGTYTENVTTKTGGTTTLVGMGTMGSVVIQANTGTVLTVPVTAMSMAFIKNLKLKSITTGNNTSKLFAGSGMMTTFNDVSFDYDISNGYTNDIIDLDAGSYVFSGCKFDLDCTGTSGGNTAFITTAGAVEFQIMQGFGTISTAAVAATDQYPFIKDLSTGSNIVRDFDIRMEALTASFAGSMGFYHSENTDIVELMGNKVVITTPSGIGSSSGNYVHLVGSGGGQIHSTGNRVHVEGFVSNNFSDIDATETFYSHFDNIVADDGVTGDGTYHYVNSPSQGDLQMSGDIIQKVVSIIADYANTEDWNFGILSATAASVDVTAVFKVAEFTALPNGAKKTFINSNTSTYNLILDPDTISVSGSTEERAIYPGGYIIIEKIGSDFIITGSSNTSFNIELADIANKSFHVDFSDSSTVTLSGTDITQVDDKINSWAGTPSSTGYATYVSAGQNGLNTALFDTNNSPISFGDRDIHSNTAGRGMTIIAVLKPDNTGDAIMSKYADDTPQREWRFYTSNITLYNNLDASGHEGIVNYSSNYGEWEVLEISWDAANGVTAYKNGFLLGTSSYSVTAIPAGTANLLMGASDYTSADFFGEIGEIIAISDTLTSDERAALTSKLGAKWGIDVAVFTASDASPFGRDDDTDTIKPLVYTDNLEIGGTLKVGSLDGDLDADGNYIINEQSHQDQLTNGAGYWFDGVDDKITIDVQTYNATDSWSLVATFHTLNNSGYPCIFGSEGGVYGAFIGWSNSSTFLIQDLANNIATLNWPLSNDMATILSISHSSESLYDIYNNGKLQGSFSLAGGYQFWTIGKGYRNAYKYFNGSIYLARLFNLALDPTDPVDKAIINGGAVPYKYEGASQTPIITGDDSDFDTDTGYWTKDANITIPGNGTCVFIDRIVDGGLSKPSILEEGKSYSVTIVISAYTAGSLKIASSNNQELTVTGVGTYSGIIVGAANGNFYIHASQATTTLTIDTVTMVRAGQVWGFDGNSAGHNTAGDVSGNGNHGVVDGATLFNIPGNHIDKTIKKTVTGDTLWTDIIPVGYILEYITFEETAGNAATLSMGTTDGGNDVFTGQTIAASSMTTITVNKYFSTSAAQDLDLNDDTGGDTWNSASVNVTLMMKKID